MKTIYTLYSAPEFDTYSNQQQSLLKLNQFQIDFSSVIWVLQDAEMNRLKLYKKFEKEKTFLKNFEKIKKAMIDKDDLARFDFLLTQEDIISEFYSKLGSKEVCELIKEEEINCDILEPYIRTNMGGVKKTISEFFLLSDIFSQAANSKKSNELLEDELYGEYLKNLLDTSVGFVKKIF